MDFNDKDGQIIGIGTDILAIARLRALSDCPEDPFFERTFTDAERKQATSRPVPLHYFSTRFAGKEAVFKSLLADAGILNFREIEILGTDSGQPVVSLKGHLADWAEGKGIHKILLSLSYDSDYAVAFAVATGTVRSHSQKE